MEMQSGCSLIDKLQYFVKESPSKTVFSYVNDNCDVIASLTYQQLFNKSRSVAHYLLEHGLKAGDRVLLVYPPSLDFIVAFIACIQVGIIAVPTFPPDPSRLNKDLQMFSMITNSCGAKAALTSSLYNYATKIASFKNIFSVVTSADELITWPELDWIVSDNIPSNFNEFTLNDDISSNDVAFLQYTSGSTSEPKGVMITHGNLAHNLKLIITGLSANPSTVVVSWLPQVSFTLTMTCIINAY